SFGLRHEATRVHHTSGWRDCGVAARGARAADPAPCSRYSRAAGHGYTRAQQSMRRVAIINVRLETDPLGQSQLKAFRQGFEKFGWEDGRNVKIDVRWAGGSAEQMREFVTELVALKPDVIVASGSPAVAALKRTTTTIPVVFVGIAEPVA